MNIDKFKHQHTEIHASIRALRRHALAGVAENARQIAEAIVAMSAMIKLHLSVEDRVLYPALRTSDSQSVARLGDRYQEDMKVIAQNYETFARKWNTLTSVSGDPEGFRREANIVLRKLHVRIKEEDTDFYPAIEAI